METGIQLIARERQEQIEKHGFSIERDLSYKSQELKYAAMYLLCGMSSFFPRTWAAKFQFAFDRKTELEKLVVAGALIAAEIDRINGLEAKP